MIKRHIVIIGSIFIFVFSAGKLKAQHIKLLQQGKPTSIRGLSVVDNKTAWISGSKGYVALTTNGGKTWNWQQVKGFEQADFRDIEAFSDKEAIIMSSGTPALILKTTDGGANWQLKYRNTDTAYFLDAMDFANAQHGFILGDPINNKFLLMETTNDGDTWHPFKDEPQALPGEAAFAASGTCLRVDEDKPCFVTGGTNSRMLTYAIGGKGWKYLQLPIIHGKSSQGAFSFALDKSNGIFVGGDYSNDKMTDSIAAIKLAMLIKPIIQAPSGFQSCVEEISNDTFLSTGTPGTNITTNGGQTWAKIDGTSFNVCRKAKHGTLVLLAGNGGKIAIFEP